ncbi:MAG: LPS export ABC transporter permease LptF [Halobacteria archaeon]|nr:LPS export ABC transporter permease LptF [Halobacteria archaeon]
MLRILDRYLLWEVLRGWLAITLILWLILASNRLVRYLAQAAAGELPGDVIFILLSVKTAWFLVYVMPFSLALGVVMALGRMYRDNEMTVMSACAVGPWRIYKPLLGMGFVIALLLVWLALYISPGIAAYGARLEKQAQEEADVSVLGAGRFNEIRGGELTFYAERLSGDRKNMQNLFVYVQGDTRRGTAPQVMVAESAYRMMDETGEEFIVFVDGHRYEGQAGDAEYRIMQFERQGVRIELPGKTEAVAKLEAVPTAQLLSSNERRDIVELQWRLSVPVSVMVLVLLSVPLSRISPRKGRFSGLAIAFLVFVVYYNLLGTAKVWVEQGVIPTSIGLWWVHLLPASLAFALLANINKLAYRIRRRS